MIRRATQADAEGIARVHVSASRAAYRGLLPDAMLHAFSVERRIASWQEWLAGDQFAVWVADENGVAGFAARGVTGDPVELYTIYVAPDRWSQGLGQALLDAALHGCPHVVLWTLEENARARRFYDAAGFVPDGNRRTEADRPVEIRYMLSPPSTSMVRPLK